MSSLERAIAIAAKAHEGQVEETGAPYILHPLRVMARLSTTEEQIIAALHEVVEDCGVALDALRKEGFSDRVVDAVDALTRRQDESYVDYLHRVAVNPLGRKLKLTDLNDHADLSRIQSPTSEDHQRAQEFKGKIEMLGEVVREMGVI